MGCVIVEKNYNRVVLEFGRKIEAVSVRKLIANLIIEGFPLQITCFSKKIELDSEFARELLNLRLFSIACEKRICLYVRLC